MNEAAPIAVASQANTEPVFIPVSRDDLIRALLTSKKWRDVKERRSLRDVFYKLGCLRQHVSAVTLNELSELYDPFNPDDETINIDILKRDIRVERQREFNDRLHALICSANYHELTDEDIEAVLDTSSPDGVHVEVDFSEYDMRLLFCRGAAVAHRKTRDIRWAYLKHYYYTIPIYRRLIMAIKLKPTDIRVGELMKEHNISKEKARKKLASLRATMPPSVSSDHIYIKIFRDIPQIDVEMLFPNIQVKMKYKDKIQLGGSAVMGFFTWLLGTATKLLTYALLTPFMLAIALITGVGGIMYAQVRNFFVTRDRYRMQLAQSLYFQNLANNQGALASIVDEAEEEDVKEEVLLYAFLLDGHSHTSHLEVVQKRINAFLKEKSAVMVTFDIPDAYPRLLAHGLVSQNAKGELYVMPPAEARRHLHERWCALDVL
jgi:uncharacterized protein involved in tellurium resistance